MRIAVDGGDLAVSVDGSNARRSPLVFIHGWALDQRVWSPQVGRFATERTVITYDRRGFGRSDAPPDPAREADDLTAILEALNLANPIVIGMSQGARVAADFARQSHATAAVFHGAPPTGADSAEGPFRVPMAMVRALTHAGRFGEIASALAAHPLFRLTGGEGHAALAAILSDYRARDVATAQPLRDWTSGLPATLPMLCIYGEDDSPARIATGRRVAGSHGNARLAIVPGAGHLASLCSPAAFNAALVSFLGEIEN